MKGNIKVILISVVGVLAVLIMGVFAVQGVKNKAIVLEEQVNTAKSDIKVQEKRRVDLIYNLVDCVKEYDKHEIEKFKLLTDPDFLEYYYSKEQGDVYNIYSSSNAGIEPATAKESLAFIPKKLRKAPKALKKMDYGKARRIRNAGMWMTVGGAVSMFAIGLPMIMSDYEEAGPLFMGLGSVAIGAGIPMWVVGSVKMKKSNASLEMGNTSSGVGLRLKF